MIKGYMTTDALILLFLFFALTIAIIIKQLQKVFTFIPYTPTLFVISILLGKFSNYLGVIGDSIETTAEIDPRGILLIFLPPLIFESSFNSDWYVFRKQSVQIFILAFPSVLVSAFIIMFAIKEVIAYDDSFYTYIEAFMFGAILSCTDTVAVLALLKEAGAPKKFSSLIEGESLLNDGTCMILFTISLEMCRGGSMGLLQIVRLFCQLTCGAVILGVIFGMVATELIRLFKNDSILCYNITLVGCYLLYFTAEYVHLGIHVSGIMALVAMGLYMAAFGRTKFTAEAREKVHHIWKVFVFVAETIIFILGGVIVGTKSLNNPKLTDLIGLNQIKNLFLLYICMCCARFLSIGVFMPKLKNLGYGLNWKEVVALTYGGLRGAVGIAFTLILAANDFLPEKFRSIAIFNMAGCAFLTLMINAPTCSSVIISLGLCVKSQTKVNLFNKFMKICHQELERRIQQIKGNKYLCNANWEKVEEQAGIVQLKEKIQQGIQKAKKNKDQMNIEMQDVGEIKRNLLSHHEELSVSDGEAVDINSMMQIRTRFGTALKGIFWRKFENNECSDLTIRKLTECIDLDLDSINLPMNSWDYLISEEQNMLFFPIIFWLQKFPLINRYAFSQIYQRISSIYDLVSTYIEGMKQCEVECREFPFERNIIEHIIEEASNNKKLAQAYLDIEIKISYPEIMKRIQTSKISISILNFQMELIQENHKQGRIDQLFYFQMKLQIEKHINQIQSEANTPVEEITEEEALKKHEFFQRMPESIFKELVAEKIELIVQKGEAITKSYQKMKYIYFVVRGEAQEQYKLTNNNHIYHKRNIKVYEFLGLSELYLINKLELQYNCLANSIVSLYGFPILKIKEILIEHPQLEGVLFKEMLPLMVQLYKEIELSHINSDIWARVKFNVEFIKVAKNTEREVEKMNVILIEGKIFIKEKEYGIGYYQIPRNAVAKVLGPAKFYQSDDKFSNDDVVPRIEIDRESIRRLSSKIKKNKENQIMEQLFDKVLREQ